MQADHAVGSAAPSATGSRVELTVATQALDTAVPAQVWSPPGLDPATPAALLAAHDGPAYDAEGGLLDYLAAGVAAGTLPPLRCALLGTADRDAWYSANRSYARAAALAVLPGLRERWSTTVVVAAGVSLGALAWLHAHRLHPRCLDGLFLQSGSFFHPRFDRHERRFPAYQRIERFVLRTLRAERASRPVPVTVTVAAAEENADNNRVMSRALAAQGYPVEHVEVPGGHDFATWRQALDPHLGDLVRRVCGG